MKKPKIIYLIDMQSFYASCEKALHPEYRNLPLIVAGDVQKRSGIVLAACPIAKSFGIKSPEMLNEAMKKCPHVTVVQPNMQHYINVSMQITKIFQEFTDLVEIYSIDEQFLDVTNSMHLFADNPIDLAKMIQSRIHAQTNVWSRVGIGENKILAKISCDLVAKKNKDGIFTLRKDELHLHIWHKDVADMWGVGRKMEVHFNRLGIHTIGDLAKYSLPKLTKRWGVNGQILWQCANGIDNSPVTPTSHNGQKAYGNGMTLPRDYYHAWEIEVVLYELCSTVCRRVRQNEKVGQVVSVNCSGISFDFPTGFHRQTKLDYPTNLSFVMFDAVKKLFHTHWDKHPVRRVGVDISQLSDDKVIQLDLFDDHIKAARIEKTLDSLKDRFGETVVLRASSLTSAGQAKDRSGKIGGHRK